MSNPDGRWEAEAEKGEEIDREIKNIMYLFAGIAGVIFLFMWLLSGR